MTHSAISTDDIQALVDRELWRHSQSVQIIPPTKVDKLLELRELINYYEQLKGARFLREYFALKAQLQDSYYLLFYRLRRCFEGQFKLRISDPLARSEAQEYEIDFGFENFEQLLNVHRRQFFEDAIVVIPMNDLRIEVIKS